MLKHCLRQNMSRRLNRVRSNLRHCTTLVTLCDLTIIFLCFFQVSGQTPNMLWPPCLQIEIMELSDHAV